MGFSAFFLVSWLACASLIVIRKKLTIIENTLIYLIILILSINFSWIIIEEMKLINLTKNPIDYLAYLLHRSVITPMILVIQLNLFQRSESLINKILVIISSLSILLLSSFYQTHFNILEYKHWNFFYELLYFLSLYVLIFIIYKLFKRATEKEVSPYDSMGEF
jgi:hypothetical protein